MSTGNSNPKMVNIGPSIVVLALVIIVMGLWLSCTARGQDYNYRSGAGSRVGTSSTNRSGVTYYRDSSGRMVGSSMIGRNGGTIRNAQGRTIIRVAPAPTKLYRRK